MKLRVRGIATDEADQIRRGGPDANGQPAVLRVAEGLANPCRHCLGLIAEGDRKLVLAYRPFDAVQPYAETGPIFLHEDPCERYESESLPAWFDYLDPAIVRGYAEDHWIRYDTGDVVPGTELTAACRTILGDPTIAYVHIRSKYNCFQCRVDRD
ncbi:MAG: DUF1203 domain-containing protein [Deltaproteobacteria bacterium]|nr:DUF1203 domain-containing protein [Deltaproteobacteria bacterium]